MIFRSVNDFKKFFFPEQAEKEKLENLWNEILDGEMGRERFLKLMDAIKGITKANQ